MFEEAKNQKSPVNRRSFLKNAGTATAAAAALGLAAPKNLFGATTGAPLPADTPAEIFTAALVAEDLATTFYFHVLVGRVITNTNLAGTGGTAVGIAPDGSQSNVFYLRAALHEEFIHAQLFRTLLGIPSYKSDPYQTFYFNEDIFRDFDLMIATLSALENAFIAAYMAAVQEFALMAAQGKPLTYAGVTYQPADLAYYAKIAASILGVESEHRALARALNASIQPANQLNYEQENGIYTVYNGATSAVAALTPFLSPASGLTAYPFQYAYENTHLVSATAIGSIPSVFFK